MSPNSLGGTTHQFNPAGGYMVVSASTKTIPQANFSDGYEAFTLQGGPGGANQSQAPRDIKIEAKCLPAGNVLDTYQFNVCAHPVNFRLYYNHCVNVCCDYDCYSPAERIGYRVNWWWDSDSGAVEDLDKDELQEIVFGLEGKNIKSGYNDLGSQGHNATCKDLRTITHYYDDSQYVNHRRVYISYISSCHRCTEDVSDVWRQPPGTIYDAAGAVKIGQSYLWTDLEGSGGGSSGTYYSDSRESGKCVWPPGCSYSWCYERLIGCPARSMETSTCP